MIFEQPLNEQMRLYLRLEYLFEELDYFLGRDNFCDHRQVLRLILEILQVIDRPDLKNRVIQNLVQCRNNLRQLEGSEAIDLDKLHKTLHELERLILALQNNSQKIGLSLRENEFLAALTQRLYTPAGTCNFNIPAYQVWLARPAVERHSQLLAWINEFSIIRNAAAVILKLIRASTTFQPISITGGLYQRNLNANLDYQLIRIDLAANPQLFPELSVSRYRLAIHFFTLDPSFHNKQFTDTVEFNIACCRL